MTNSRLRFLFLTLILLLAAQFPLQAQQKIGVRWNVPENTTMAVHQLERFNSLGISLLEIDSDLSPKIWRKIDSLRFDVYGSLGIKYPVASTFSRPDTSLILNIQKRASAYLSHPSVTAIGLFEYGATHDPAFSSAIRSVANQLKKLERPLYYVTRSKTTGDTTISNFVLFEKLVEPSTLDTLSLPHRSHIKGYIYAPTDDLARYLTPFKKFLSAASVTRNKALFVDSSWLLNILDRKPHFSKIVQTLTSESEAIFPLPDEKVPSSNSIILPILILLLVWGTIAWHYNGSPLYRKSLFRYFLAHKFFINDIFQRQIRSSLPAFTIIVQNALLVAASSFTAFSSLFSTHGQTAFFYHFPLLNLLGKSPFSIFLWMFLTTILISFVSIVWLSITHRSISSLTQIPTIYAWPLQLNFIFCTLTITIFSADGSHYWVTFFSTISLLVFILSFIFASLDTLRFSRSKFKHLIKTVIPYLLVIGGFIIWFLTKDQWIEVISLGLNLT